MYNLNKIIYNDNNKKNLSGDDLLYNKNNKINQHMIIIAIANIKIRLWWSGTFDESCQTFGNPRPTSSSLTVNTLSKINIKYYDTMAIEKQT